jgi:hypothetical protein
MAAEKPAQEKGQFCRAHYSVDGLFAGGFAILLNELVFSPQAKKQAVTVKWDSHLFNPGIAGFTIKVADNVC